MSKDLYPKAKEIFEAATREGKFRDFSEAIRFDDFVIFRLDLFDRAHQKRLIDVWNVFETANIVKEILMRHPDFEGVHSDAFDKLSVELWQIYRSTPRSFEELSKRTREAQQQFSQLSKYNTTLKNDGEDIYESERELQEARSAKRSFGRRALDWVLMYIPGFSREATRRIVRDDTRNWHVSDAEEKLERQKEAVFEQPIATHGHEVDVQILLAELPTRVLEEIKAHRQEK